jgi:hypothetical protein
MSLSERQAEMKKKQLKLKERLAALASNKRKQNLKQYKNKKSENK